MHDFRSMDFLLLRLTRLLLLGNLFYSSIANHKCKIGYHTLRTMTEDLAMVPHDNLKSGGGAS